jgi:hypothetical protein
MAFEEFLEHHLVASIPEAPLLEALSQRDLRLFVVLADGDALARGQARRLHHERAVRPVVEERTRQRHLVVDPEARARNAVLAAKLARERLAAFDLGGRLVGAKAQLLRLRELVDDAVAQRRLGADHGQVDLLVDREAQQSSDVLGRDVDVLRHLCGARIAGRAEQALEQRRLRELPAEGVFTAALAYDEYVHERAGAERNTLRTWALPGKRASARNRVLSFRSRVCDTGRA